MTVDTGETVFLVDVVGEQLRGTGQIPFHRAVTLQAGIGFLYRERLLTIDRRGGGEKDQPGRLHVQYPNAEKTSK